MLNASCSRAAARCPAPRLAQQLLARFIVSHALLLPAEVPAGFSVIIVIVISVNLLEVAACAWCSRF